MSREDYNINYDYDYLFKILIIGDSGTGKTSLLNRYVDDIYDEKISSTIGVDVKIKNITHGDKNIKLQIWETSGQLKFRNIISCYYKNCHGILLVFDLSDINTFENVKIWLEEIKLYTEFDIPKLLIGSKTDLAREVSDKEIQEFIHEYDLNYVEISSKNNVNISKVFDEISKEIRSNRKYCLRNLGNKTSIKLETKSRSCFVCSNSRCY